ncbi:MAG: hypothetical protein MK125_08595, partial [Dehalococcoidia bacterium]|nr:hypothetical protein [Dehalococcoidia bacterium]
MATDSQDRVYVFQRKDPPVMIFERDGNYLNSRGISAITDPHGIFIEDAIMYVTDRADSVALKFTLDGSHYRLLAAGVFIPTPAAKFPGKWCPSHPGPSIIQRSWCLRL